MRWRGIARRSLPYLVAVASGFLVAYLIIALFAFPRSLVSSDGKVPNVTALSWDAAERKLAQAGFTARRGEQRFSASAPAGIVLAQNPAPDAVEPKGAKVVLDLSRGQQTVEVPEIVGLTRQQAEAALQNAGLDAGDVSEAENSAPLGQVLLSNPPAGTKVPVASPVAFTVSTGPATVAVPDVTGQSYPAARQLLSQLGFQVVQGVPDSTSRASAGTVTSQSPAANQSVPGGTTIKLRVSAGIGAAAKPPAPPPAAAPPGSEPDAQP